MQSVRELRESNAKKDAAIKRLKYDLLFSSHMIEQYADITSKLHELQCSMFCRSRESVRALILAVIFARRMVMYCSTETTDDPSALSVFSGRLKSAPDAQLADIRQKVAGLTQDLVVAKQTIASFGNNMKSFEEERESLVVQLRTKADQAELSRQKLMYTKKRMQDLQDELGTLVAPAEHEKLCLRLSDADATNESLQAAICKYKEELERLSKSEGELRDRMEEVLLASEQEAARSEELEQQLGERERKIEGLEAVIREKTREILSLERLVNRQKERASVENTSINVLATENRALLSKAAPDEHVSDTGIAANVNPAFL